jgi:hypothetical protein
LWWVLQSLQSSLQRLKAGLSADAARALHHKRGDLLKCTISAVKPYAVLAEVDGALSALITNEHCKGVVCKVGEVHEARLLDVDFAKVGGSTPFAVALLEGAFPPFAPRAQPLPCQRILQLQGTLDLSILPELVASMPKTTARGKRAAAVPALGVGDTLEAEVQLVKETHLIVKGPQGHLLVARA